MREVAVECKCAAETDAACVILDCASRPPAPDLNRTGPRSAMLVDKIVGLDERLPRPRGNKGGQAGAHGLWKVAGRAGSGLRTDLCAYQVMVGGGEGRGVGSPPP